MSWAASKAVGPRDLRLAVERMEASKRVHKIYVDAVPMSFAKRCQWCKEPNVRRMVPGRFGGRRHVGE